VLGFVGFGVGSNIGGTGIADLLQGSGGGSGPDVDKAEKNAQEHPQSAAAWRELATALQQDGQTDEAIAPLQRYVALRPKDEDALTELAGLQLAKANRVRNQAALAQQRAIDLQPETDILPPSTTKLGQALGSQAIYDAVSKQANDRFTAAYQRMTAAYSAAQGTYGRLAAITPDDPSIQFQLADAAESAGDTATALKAYKRFVKLAPDDPSTPDIKARIKELEKQSSTGTTAAAG
jgi:tetratricopeptide (TPR) repeat protein